MTEDIKNKYMRNPDKCPYCGGELSVIENYEAINNYEGLRETACSSCFKRFSETHKLIDVNELGGN
ncbi:MAG: hypothetical protein BWY74_01849 [Firmicutes bacterium ADurb.Bin419]|nr:MAG: hypothetical protein BWY74_01849 [Firmicutes bacterium ADurb.Bin419]